MTYVINTRAMDDDRLELKKQLKYMRDIMNSAMAVKQFMQKKDQPIIAWQMAITYVRKLGYDLIDRFPGIDEKLVFGDETHDTLQVCNNIEACVKSTIWHLEDDLKMKGNIIKKSGIMKSRG